jgi:hypothetical protein
MKPQSIMIGQLIRGSAVILGAAALVALATGCATPKEKQATQQQTESMLLASGFKVVPATTPDQQQQIKTLPAGRISAVNRSGKAYFVYPVHAKNILYVGNNNQYLAYQQLAQQSQVQVLVKQEDEAMSRSLASPGWEAPWGDWDMP